MKNISEDIYNSLDESIVNAWAIWDDDFKKGIDPKPQYFDEVSEYLKPSIIFLGLNPSKDLDKHGLINFHNPESSNDRKLKLAIQGDNRQNPACPNLLGGFMTDIIVDKSVANSAYVDVEHVHAQQFEAKLETLGQEKYHLICFGNKTYNAIQSWLLNEKENDPGVLLGHPREMSWDINIYKVVHFAATVKTQEFMSQLKAVDKFVGK